MSLWRLYYHLVWATKKRQPLITSTLEPQLYRYIIGKSDALGCIVHAVGGIEDHIHLVVSIPPSLSIANFVKQIKGSSAHYLNHYCASPSSFKWQRGYGVFSLGEKQLDRAVAYVKRQKFHHAQRTAIASLENSDEDHQHSL